MLGHRSKIDLERVREVIRDYWSRGIRVGAGTKYLPEFGCSGYALWFRVKNQYGINLGDEVSEICGPAHPPKHTVEQLRDGFLAFLRRVRKKPSSNQERIDELGMTYASLKSKLSQMGTSLTEQMRLAGHPLY